MQIESKMHITVNIFVSILIDEIETGFHYSMFDKLWEVIATTAKKNNCQIIATTHIYECMVVRCTVTFEFAPTIEK